MLCYQFTVLKRAQLCCFFAKNFAHFIIDCQPFANNCCFYFIIFITGCKLLSWDFWVWWIWRRKEKAEPFQWNLTSWDEIGKADKIQTAFGWREGSALTHYNRVRVIPHSVGKCRQSRQKGRPSSRASPSMHRRCNSCATGTIHEFACKFNSCTACNS